MFLGIMMTGGLLGVLLFLSLCIASIYKSFYEITKLDDQHKLLGFSFISFYLAFLVGGLTENLMHIMAYPFLVLNLIKMIPKGVSMNKNINQLDDNITEKEIGLFAVIVKRKKIVMRIILLTLLMLCAYVYKVQPIYESRAVVQIGSVMEIGSATNMDKNGILQPRLIEEPETLIIRLNGKYLNNDGAGKDDHQTLYSINLEGKNNVVIIARGGSPIQVQSFLDNITNELMNEHRMKFDGIRALQKEYIDKLQRKLNVIDAENNYYDAKIKVSDGTIAILSILEKAKNNEQRISIEQEIFKLQAVTSETYLTPTQIIQYPTLASKPVLPKPLYIVLAGVVGVICAILIALLVEVFSKNQAQRKT
jgi:hypothetical protein